MVKNSWSITSFDALELSILTLQRDWQPEKSLLDSGAFWDVKTRLTLWTKFPSDNCCQPPKKLRFLSITESKSCQKKKQGWVFVKSRSLRNLRGLRYSCGVCVYVYIEWVFVRLLASLPLHLQLPYIKPKRIFMLLLVLTKKKPILKTPVN